MAALLAPAFRHSPVRTIVANWFARHRGTAISIVNAGSGAGQSALLLLVKLLIDQIGWRHTYLYFGLAILVISTILILLFLYIRPEDRGLTIEDELRRRRREAAGAKIKTGGEEPEEGNRGDCRTEVIILDTDYSPQSRSWRTHHIEFPWPAASRKREGDGLEAATGG